MEKEIEEKAKSIFDEYKRLTKSLEKESKDSIISYFAVSEIIRSERDKNFIELLLRAEDLTDRYDEFCKSDTNLNYSKVCDAIKRLISFVREYRNNAK